MKALFALPNNCLGAVFLIFFWWPLALMALAIMAAFTLITTTGMQRELPQRKGLFIILTGVAIASIGTSMVLNSVATARGAIDDLSVATAVSFLGIVSFAAIATIVILGIRRIVSRRRTMSPEEHRRYYAQQDQKPDWLYWPGQAVPPREPQRLRDLPLLRFYERRPKFTIASVGAGLVVLMTAGSLSISAVPTWAQEAEVIGVVDGDTVDVRVDGVEERVRILNMNAPEDNAVTGESECLGPEATAALEYLLPVGSRIELAYDDARRDRYDRLLAKVNTANGISAGSALIAKGLAVPAEYGDNVRYLSESNSALAKAEAAQAGIFSPAVECSPVAEIESLQSGAAAITAPTEQQASAELAATTTAVAAALATVTAAKAAATAIDWVTPEIRNRWLRSISDIAGQLTKHQTDAVALTPIAVAREAEDARLAAEAAAKQAESDRIAEEQRVAEELRLAEEQRQAEAAQESEEWTSDSNAGGGGDSGSSGGYDGYTGCRAYGSGGTSIDEQGRPYTKIDCTTKLPL